MNPISATRHLEEALTKSQNLAQTRFWSPHIKAWEVSGLQQEKHCVKNGHDVRPLILHEQGLSGIPLKTGKDSLPKSSDEYKPRQEFHSSSVALSPFLKAGYVAFLLVIAVAIVYYGHRQLIDKWNRQAFLKGITYLTCQCEVLE